ncbi:MAG: hypothetical protein QOK26_1045, partial [Pseudonocardiales bacterium]|nr:hypothetical protein [Pseudonocardiales bacterium]
MRKDHALTANETGEIHAGADRE